MIKNFLLNILFFLTISNIAFTPAYAEITCKGRVVDCQSEVPLIGATVLLENAKQLVGTATDINGFFSLNVPENSILKFQYFGGYQVELMAKEDMGDIILTKGKGNGFKKVKNITENVKNQWNEERLTLIAKQQFKDAYSRFRASSDMGSSRGMFLLAQCYRNEIGVKKDLKKYVDCMLSSADNGYDKAQYQVGLMYRDGDILEKNLKLAEAYLNKAAQQGNPEASAAFNSLTLGK